MKKNIAIIAGGDSSEIVVSLKSAQGIYSFIDKDKYSCYIAIVKKDEWSVTLPEGKQVPIDKNDFSFKEEGVTKHFDFAYITIHGTPGENGLLQGYFELIGLPYSSCNVLASALTFNKFMCNNYLRNFGIRIADSVRLTKDNRMEDEAIISRLGLPVFVKPNDGGSSFGVTKVKEAGQLQAAVEKAFAEGNEVIIEQFIAGTEVTCGCYKTKEKTVIFPLTEVVSKNEFFDFDAKYNGQSDEITPARIEQGVASTIRRQTSVIYDLLGAKGLIRVDYIIPADGTPVLLEVNTTPGMTPASFIPQQVRAAGLEIKDVMTDIIENELNS
ncbi:D-alanine-D-alanine ligase [Parabacteroides sp. PF5-5]|uniref:D-alanine--D-alanine ligase n=1 Tax=unclassified Parabacteroides TaxID=2649774 RepID=UPI0024763519|nr:MULTISPECIES: D-alanine--D-alanine ligase [unclassified Parabacteroides]MDH6305720.1 D-alanine-D-alanine ligase [Parabacteroides sp. PH5-39]MDH6316792.1 D-alanine-D-alanine ligase [Parabacteroides sp. PF5-13]MDH6320433.1 D-alanine-D-alanine ligase [Parabacteroides sp. PH5-13]MDH6324163.1 D-alanine-D-alanine ligase [Parabacteroides sp. PH5-8]MDH6327978.1 D-alanine-D-alanine ligase [Parabacteroides sp. PH5-41]